MTEAILGNDPKKVVELLEQGMDPLSCTLDPRELYQQGMRPDVYGATASVRPSLVVTKNMIVRHITSYL